MAQAMAMQDMSEVDGAGLRSGASGGAGLRGRRPGGALRLGAVRAARAARANGGAA